MVRSPLPPPPEHWWGAIRVSAATIALMDNDLRAAVAELREWAARAGYSMTHMDDAAVLAGIERCMTRLPDGDNFDCLP
jgi:hypothetical protein